MQKYSKNKLFQISKSEPKQKISDEFYEDVNPDGILENSESIEKLALGEAKSIIRICDMCGNEMLLHEGNLFVCENCGYHFKTIKDV
ncbi:MAG: hypothetical protein ABDH21_03780 [bacterium]